MDTATPTPPSFGEENFGAAQLRHRRRSQRLAQLADLLLQHPRGTLPEKLSHPKDLKAFYRLMATPVVTHDTVFDPHRALTRRRMDQAGGPILLLHDGTELDFSGLSLPDLGQLGNGNTRGLLCHNCLAVQAEGRRVLGLLHQTLYRRPHVPAQESRTDRRARQDRESRLWQQACEAIGPAPAGRRHVDICDRGADLFEFLEFEHRHGRSYVVRATHDRALTVEDEGTLEVLGYEGPHPGQLFGLARSLPEWGRKEVAVPARPGQPARTAVVRLAAAPVRLHAPKNARGEHGQEPLPVWVVYAGEVDPPAGRQPVEWVLLTDVPVRTYEDLVERVGWYEARWLVEELHKGQKTGCDLEKLQLGKRNHDERGRPYKNRLEPAIALLSVVAVQLLILRQRTREESAAGQPATEWFEREEVAVLAGWRYGDATRPLTVREFGLALARLGGHQNRTGDGPPGWQTLWRGWEKLQLMVLGARLAGGAGRPARSEGGEAAGGGQQEGEDTS